ncbi:hypothetical protein DFP72DRAFT_879276 [Ephemerocybe angulata]|uniref:Uncharacterized protein n=1 Tax=Ephemerocybe angulata TaxID=980116 RepID=A0A8H6ICF3_9AGAR|nr:hypothetical protein DFP72DRAFT_879276 [Tulosesus angulatus]
MSIGSCQIPGNPDITGIGIRIAIYVQGFISFTPGILALVDGKVTRGDLEAAETQATTNLVLAFAILVSFIVQALTLGLVNYHASIVLSMSWLNNTNTFIYFLIDLLASLLPGASSKGTSKRCAAHGANGGEGTPTARTRSKILVRRFVLLLGLLHLSLMASLGLWMWSNIQTFGNGADTSLNDCAARFAIIIILGKRVHFSSEALRIASLVFYAIFLVPGLNLALPIAVLLGLYNICRRHLPTPTSTSKHRPGAYKRSWAILPPFIGLILLLVIDVLTLEQNASLQGMYGREWGFGQILAMLLLLVPLRNLAETILARRIKQRQRDSNLGLKSGVEVEEDANTELEVRGATTLKALIGPLVYRGLTLSIRSGTH